MESAMLKILSVMEALSQAGAMTPLPATDIW
jgi:hypothetical protein